METKHTKEEWLNDEEFIVAGNKTICMLADKHPDFNKNKKIIVAARELLNALKCILDFPEDDLENWANGESKIEITILPIHLKQALNAIKKATE